MNSKGTIALKNQLLLVDTLEDSQPNQPKHDKENKDVVLNCITTSVPKLSQFEQIEHMEINMALDDLKYESCSPQRALKIIDECLVCEV